MNLRVYLFTNKATKDGKHAIKVSVFLDGKYIDKVITSIYKSDWNPKNKRMKAPKTGAKDNGFKSVNDRIEKLETDFKELVLKCQSNRIPITETIIKQFLNSERIYTGKEKPFWDAYQEYLEQLNVKPKTRMNYELYHTKLKEFEQETGYLIDYATITPAFAENYKYYILTKKNLSWNTYATAIKKLKFFMVWALKMEHHSETSFRKFSATEKEPTVITLTEKELTTLYNWDFHSDRLNQVRDLFCFSCLTGLSYVDISTLRREHLDKGTIIKHRVKSKQRIETPLPEAAKKILERYSGKFKPLPKISNQKYNEYIRECAMIAGIDAPVIYLDFTGGKTTEITKPKYEVLSSHKGRKTFISLYYQDTKDYIGTKKNAGISQDKTMRRYIGRDSQQARENMNKAFKNIDTSPRGPERLDFTL